MSDQDPVQGVLALTMGNNQLEILDTVSRFGDVLVWGYVFHGIPLVAGEPYTDYFVLKSDSMDQPAIISTTALNGTALPLTGATTRVQLERPLKLGRGRKSGKRMGKVHMRVEDLDGNQAQFTSAFIEVTVYANNCPCHLPYNTQVVNLLS